MKTAAELREYHRKWRAANPEKVKAHTLKQRGAALYRWLKANGYPRDEFRLLCFNCNSGRKLGPCPHERSRPVLVPFE